MKIVDFKIGKIKTPLKRPFKTALRTCYFIEDIVIKIYTDNGIVGHGSCAPVFAVTGETHQSLLGSLTLLKEKLLNIEFSSLEKIINYLSNNFVGNTSAFACLDMALHDVYCQYLNLPLYKYLGGDHNLVFSNLTISVNAPEIMVADSLVAVSEGFCELKMKVGLDPLDDFKRVMAVANAVGSKVKLRIDANQGWKPKEAVKLIRKLEAENLNLELVEQPVKQHDLEGMAFVKERVQTDILADESVFSPQDALRVIQKNAADLINIKLAKAGGLLAATKIYHIAQTAGIECFMGCMLESSIAVNAAIHFAAAKKNLHRCDLDPPFLISENPVESSVSQEGNVFAIDDNLPGLGIKTIHNFEIEV